MSGTPLPIANGSGGATINSTTPVVQLIPSGIRRFQRIVNNGPGTLWCTRDPLATPTVNGASSYPIQSGATEEFSATNEGYVPTAATWATSDMVNVPTTVTVEIG